MPSSTRSENDSSRVVVPGSHARYHGHFEAAAQQAKHDSRNLAATSDMMRPGTFALVNDGFFMVGGNSERPMRKPFKHGLSGNSVAPMLSMGSQNMLGMERCSRVGTFISGDGITAGATSGRSVWSGSTMVTGGSVHTPGMAKATERSSNVLGLAAGRSVHHGGTFVTTGSLESLDNDAWAAADAAKKKKSPEILGAISGKSAWEEGGTLLTNGSVNTPGMAQAPASGMIRYPPSRKIDSDLPKSNTNTSASAPLPKCSLEICSASIGGAITRGAAAGKSVDKGLSLFAMGSMLSEANAEVERHKQQRSDSEARFRHVASTELPLWSLGSKLSIAAAEEERQNSVQQRIKGAGGGAVFGNTFGAAAALGVVQNSAIPMLSLGSTTAPGMHGSERAITRARCGNTHGFVSVLPSSSSSCLWSKTSTATLLNSGSVGTTPGMSRNKAFHTSGNSLLGAVTVSSTSTSTGGGGCVGLLMMGSVGTSGMARDSKRVPGVWSNTGGAVAGFPLQTSTVGTKTTSSDQASLVLDQTISNGCDDPNYSIAAERDLFGNTFGAAAAGKSVDFSGGGTMLTSGSHGAMERSWSAGVIVGQSGGRSITHGADATGKPVFTGITFGTGGSSGLRVAENTAKQHYNLSKRSLSFQQQRPMHAWQKLNGGRCVNDGYSRSSLSSTPSSPPITMRSGQFTATTHRVEGETGRDTRATAKVRHCTNTRESSALKQSLIRGGTGLNYPDAHPTTTKTPPTVEEMERALCAFEVKPAAAWAYRMAYLSSPDDGNTPIAGCHSVEGDDDVEGTDISSSRGDLTAGQRAVDRAIARAVASATSDANTSRTQALSHVAGITKTEMAAARLIADGRMAGANFTNAAQLPERPPPPPPQQQLDLAVSVAVLRAEAAAMRAQVSSEAAFENIAGKTKPENRHPRRM